MTKEKKKIELIKLTIQIGDTKVNVTKDEARDLHKALSEMFGEKTTEKHVHHYDYQRPWYWPTTYWGCGTLGDSGLLKSYQGIEETKITCSGGTIGLLEHNVGNVSLLCDNFKITD